MHGSEIREVAQKLIDLGGAHEEARHRSAVSRLYYSAFVQARDLLTERRGFLFNKKNVHAELLRSYAFAEDKVSRILSKNLEALKKLREGAEYSTTTPDDPDALAEAQALYTDVVARLATIDPNVCRDPALDRGGS